MKLPSEPSVICAPACAWTTLPPPGLAASQKKWLGRPGALTEGLRRCGVLDLVVLAQGPSHPRLDEAIALRLPINGRVWIREVRMSINEIPCVVARSVTSLAASRTAWRGIRNLGKRPLADLLYDDKRVRRGAFEATRVTSRQGIWLALRRQPGCLPGPWVARRSVFLRHGQRLLVAECFLPASWHLLESASVSDFEGET